MSIKPAIGKATWIAHDLGPMARDALGAIGCPSDAEEISIESMNGAYSLNGQPVAKADADLVYNAWRCDPRPFLNDADLRLIDHMRRAITVRRLLGGTAA